MKKIKHSRGDGPNAIRGALKGALKGALTGGAAGSAGGAGGAIIGGVSGAVIGGISGSKKENNSQSIVNLTNMASHTSFGSALAEQEAKVDNSTPVPPPTTPAPAIDPQQSELARQAKEVRMGNVNPAQAEYFKQQNEGLYTQKERTGAESVSQSTRVGATVNPVSNRQNDNLDNLFGDLYGSQKSRGIV